MKGFLSSRWFGPRGFRADRPQPSGRRPGYHGGRRPLPLLELLEERLVMNASPELFGQLPLAFEANLGQTDAQARFLSRGPGYGLFLTPQEAVLSLLPPAVVTADTPSAPAIVRM